MKKNNYTRFTFLPVAAVFCATTAMVFAAGLGFHSYKQASSTDFVQTAEIVQSGSGQERLEHSRTGDHEPIDQAEQLVADNSARHKQIDSSAGTTPGYRSLADNGINYPEDVSRPWLATALASLPDSVYWRSQVEAHLAQARTPGWEKFENHALNNGHNPLKLPTFAQMAESDHIAAKLTVRLREGVSAENALDDLGLGISHATAIDAGQLTGGLHTYNVYPGLAVYDVLESVNAHRSVVYAEPDYVLDMAFAPNVPDDPLVGPDAWWLDQVNAYEAWDVATDARSLGPILVVDSGISRNHEDLQGNFWINPDEIAGNGVDDDNNGFIDDINGLTSAPSSPHGTSVGGTLCARGNNAIGYTGVVWRCQLLDGNAGGSWDSVSSATSALIYATDKGSRLSNHSYRIPSYSQVMKDVITQVAASDHLLVIAAHNFAQNIDIDPIYPAAFDNENILSIAGSNVAENRVNYSDYGVVSVDLAAPTEFQTTELSGGYARFAGTSQSTPMVTAAVALAWTQVPDWNYSQIKQLTVDSARPVASWQGLTVSGGILDMQAMMAAVDSGRDPVAISINDIAVEESDGSATLTVSLSRPASNPVQVTVFTREVNGSAVGGEDFYGRTEVLNFAVGESSASFSVVILADGIDESDETLTVRLAAESGGIVSDRVGLITINNHGDGSPELSIADQTVSEGTGPAQIPVTLSQPALGVVTVTAFTRPNGSALPGQDFFGTTQLLSFAPGETTQMVRVTILEDSTAEGPETFSVRLNNASGATIVDNIATVTIGDAATNASLSIDSILVNEGDGSADLTVSLSSAVDASVDVHTRGQSADGGGVDYFGFSRTLNFSASGGTTQTVTVRLNDDDLAEATESMTVRLIRPSGANVSVAVGTVTITDND